MSRRMWAGFAIAGSLLARPDVVRFLRWPEIQPLWSSLTAAGEKLPEFAKPSDWDNWIRQRDFDVRTRVDRALTNSIGDLILFGASFTSRPRIASPYDAVSAAGKLTPAARARVEAFAEALDSRDDERFRYALDFLRRQGVTQEELPAYLAGIARRAALDRARDTYQRNVPPVLMDFAAAETLRMLKTEGRVPARIHRLAVISPALDFSGGPDGYDIFALHSTQPFATLEAVLRLGLAQADDVQAEVFALDPFTLAHLRAMSARARAGGTHALQLGRNKTAGWNAAAASYWGHVGEMIGTATPPAPLSAEAHNIETRIITVKPQMAARIGVEEMDIVAQTADVAPGAGFDLVVALDGLARYNRLEQSLALANLAAMMNRGAIALANTASPAAVPAELEGLGQRRIAYSDRGGAISITVYRRR